MSLGEKIQFYRKQKNLSQEQLGEMLFVSRQTVSQWEKDQTTPTIDNLLKLKEIFGVSVDELLSKDTQTVQKNIQAQDEPPESITVCYQKDDISRAIRGANKKRMIPLLVITGVLLIYTAQSLTGQDVGTTGFMFGAFLFVAVLTAISFVRLRSVIKNGEQQTLDKVFQYDVYENHIEQTVSRDGEIVSTRKIQFSELSDIRQYGNLIVFRYVNQLFILHAADLTENSRFYWFLRSRITEKQKPNRKGSLTAISIILFVLSIASIWIALIVAAAMSWWDPYLFPHNLRIFLAFLLIPVGSIVFGVVTQRKGYAYKKNIVVGIIMAALLLVYGLFVAK